MTPSIGARSGRRSGVGAEPREASAKEVASWLSLVAERFAIPEEAFAPFRFLLRRDSKVFAVSRDHRPPAHPAPAATGLPFLHVGMRHPKLTTAAALAFGGRARRNIVDLSRGETDRYFQRFACELPSERLKGCTGTGYVLARHRGVVLGVAFLHLAEPLSRFVSLYPKGWTLAEGRSAFSS